jgi:hypothetical protein
VKAADTKEEMDMSTLYVAGIWVKTFQKGVVVKAGKVL